MTILKKHQEINSLQEFVGFSTAEQILKKRFPDTTYAEMHMWCFLGGELGGLDAKSEYVPTQYKEVDQNIFASLVSRNFNKNQLESFVPLSRWLAYDQLLLRWEPILGQMQAKIRIDEFFKEGELDTICSLRGIADEATQAIFMLTRIEYLEAMHLNLKNEASVVADVWVNSASSGLAKREQQLRAIEDEATILGYDKLQIKIGGKRALLLACKKKYPNLFGGGDHPFLDAWKAGVASNPPRLRMKDHAKFSGKYSM